MPSTNLNSTRRFHSHSRTRVLRKVNSSSIELSPSSPSLPISNSSSPINSELSTNIPINFNSIAAPSIFSHLNHENPNDHETIENQLLNSINEPPSSSINITPFLQWVLDRKQTLKKNITF